MGNKTILVTGFGPFPGQPENPSARLMARLAAARITKPFNLHARVLPTEYAAAGPALRRAIAEVRPDIVICFGVAARRDRINIERAAWNVTDPDRRDAAGRRPRGRIIDADGPEGYASTLPLADIAAALARAGIPADGSNDAGDYVCNHVFYGLMADIAQAGGNPPLIGGFVHVPVPRAGTAMTEDRLAEAAFIIARTCAAQRGPHAPPRALKDRALWTGKTAP